MLTAYLSHAIRGKYGANATDAQMKENCDRACVFAARIRELIPTLDLYVPGEKDLFVQKAYRMGLLTERQILDVDYELIRDRDFLLVYGPDGQLSSGMRREVYFAVENQIPVCLCKCIYLSDSGIDTIHQGMLDLERGEAAVSRCVRSAAVDAGGPRAWRSGTDGHWL